MYELIIKDQGGFYNETIEKSQDYDCYFALSSAYIRFIQVV